jgi:hypothetical protein
MVPGRASTDRSVWYNCPDVCGQKTGHAYAFGDGSGSWWVGFCWGGGPWKMRVQANLEIADLERDLDQKIEWFSMNRHG